MKKKIFLRTISLFLVAICILPYVLCSCETGDATLLSFKSAASYDYLKTLNGQKVSIKGWIATASPVNGSFVFLMNMPYQSCPYCKPNTNQLANTIEVYPKEKQSFEFTAELVRVIGTLMVADDNKFFTDSYGYEFSFKIVDAEYVVVDDDELPEDLAFWQKVAQSDLLSELDQMFSYLYFVCGEWCTKIYTFSTKGNDYLSPPYLSYVLFEEHENKGNYYYGYKEGYFDKLISKVLKIDKEKLTNIVTIILKAENLAKKAISEIENENYSKVPEYSIDRDPNSERYRKLNFGDGRKQYTMDNSSLMTECDNIYTEFYGWFSGWEL